MTEQRAAGFAAVLAALAAVCTLPAAAADPPARIVAIGDVHGAYDEFVALLEAAGLVDVQLDWRGGDARLVVLGDVLDRGAESRRVLELIIRLREQAPLSGGEAELVLGNHEVMNLLGDLTYVTPAEYAAYRADESPRDREAAWQRFRAGSDGGDAEVLTAQFAARYPPGFFGHRAAFSLRGPLGAWLHCTPRMLSTNSRRLPRVSSQRKELRLQSPCVAPLSACKPRRSPPHSAATPYFGTAEPPRAARRSSARGSRASCACLESTVSSSVIRRRRMRGRCRVSTRP
jgi:hypothetical protein